MDLVFKNLFFRLDNVINLLKEIISDEAVFNLSFYGKFVFDFKENSAATGCSFYERIS